MKQLDSIIMIPRYGQDCKEFVLSREVPGCNSHIARGDQHCTSLYNSCSHTDLLFSFCLDRVLIGGDHRGLRWMIRWACGW